MNADLKPLPEIATYHFQPEKAEIYADALCDINCWLAGFIAAGGTYSPQTQEVLRDLASAMKAMLPNGSTSTQSHI